MCEPLAPTLSLGVVHTVKGLVTKQAIRLTEGLIMLITNLALVKSVFVYSPLSGSSAFLLC